MRFLRLAIIATSAVLIAAFLLSQWQFFGITCGHVGGSANPASMTLFWNCESFWDLTNYPARGPHTHYFQWPGFGRTSWGGMRVYVLHFPWLLVLSCWLAVSVSLWIWDLKRRSSKASRGFDPILNANCARPV